MSISFDEDLTAEVYEFGLLQQLRHEFEPRGFIVFGTENGEQHRVRGRYSLCLRQLDAAVYRSEEDDIPFFIADSKRHGRNLNVKHIECFIGMMDDVGADIGLLVAPQGFSEAAKRRAMAADLRVEVMTPDEALDAQWLPIARSVYPHDWIFHLEIAKAIRNLKAGAEPEAISDVLTNVAFEECKAFVQYALIDQSSEAVEMLEWIATYHLDDGWRYNAIQMLSESGNLNQSFIRLLKSQEQDPEIIDLVDELTS
jgi:hypothetical protein